MIVKLPISGPENRPAIRERTPAKSLARRNLQTGRQTLMFDPRAHVERELLQRRPVILRIGGNFEVAAIVRILIGEVDLLLQHARGIDDIDRPKKEPALIAQSGERRSELQQVRTKQIDRRERPRLQPLPAGGTAVLRTKIVAAV